MDKRQYLRVLAGPGREHVGYIRPAAGMVTNWGVVDRVTQSGTVFLRGEGGAVQVRGAHAHLSVTLTEARKRGYPRAAGCIRRKNTFVRRNGALVLS